MTDMTHEVLIAPARGRAKWQPCAVVGRRAYRTFLGAPVPDAFDADGVRWSMCHPECVRVRRGAR